MMMDRSIQHRLIVGWRASSGTCTGGHAKSFLIFYCHRLNNGGWMCDIEFIIGMDQIVYD